MSHTVSGNETEKMTAAIHEGIDGSVEALEQLHGSAALIAEAASVISGCLASGGRVLACGNGGSAADAQHFAAELAGRFAFDRAPLPAIALATNSSVVTAVANDYGYDQVFSRQVAGLASAGDVLLAISTSGTSPSVLEAARVARESGVKVIGLTGRNGRDLEALSDVCIAVASAQTPRIQEGHALVLHLLCEIVEAELFGVKAE